MKHLYLFSIQKILFRITNPLLFVILVLISFFGTSTLSAQSTVEVINPSNATQKIIAYTDVPSHPTDVALQIKPSDRYKIEVRILGTTTWIPVFAHKTYNQNGVDFTTDLPVTDGGNNPNTSLRNYINFTAQWTHTYGNIEMTPNTSVQVRITKLDGTLIPQPIAITKAAAHPVQKIVGTIDTTSGGTGAVIFTIDKPGQIVIDFDGAMDDTNKGLLSSTAQLAAPHVHAVSIFANPIMTGKPAESGDSDVYYVTPGTIPPSDLGSKTTLYFLPGVHNIGLNFKLYPNKQYYFPGDAIVYGTFNNLYLPTGTATPTGINIKVFGYGTISGAKQLHPAYVELVGGVATDTDLYKSIEIDDGIGTIIEGVTIADPSNHSIHMLPDGTTFNSLNPKVPMTFAKWVKVISWRGNGDGIGSCHEVSDCFFRTNDDAGYIKGSKFRNIFWKDSNAAIFHMAGIPIATEYFPLKIEDCEVIYARSRNLDGSGNTGVFHQRATAAAFQTNAPQAVNLTVTRLKVSDPLSNMPVFNMFTQGFDNNNVVQQSGPSYTGLVFNNVEIASDVVKQTIQGNSLADWGDIKFNNCKIAGRVLSSADFKTVNITNYPINLPYATLVFTPSTNLGITDAILPDNPTASVASAIGENQQTISWTAASGTEGVDGGGYMVVRGTAPISSTPSNNDIYVVNNTVAAGELVVYVGTGISFTDTGLDPATTYYYKIYSVDKSYNYGNTPITITSATNTASTFVFSTAGSGSWTVPSGVYSIIVNTWGGGGAGGSANCTIADISINARGGGGAGGSFASATIFVQPGDLIDYVVGAGGAGSTAGFANGSYSTPGGFSSANLNSNSTPFVKALGGPSGQNASVSAGNSSGTGGVVIQSGNTGSPYWGGNGGTAGAGSGAGGGSAGSTGNGTAGLLLTAVGVGGAGLIAPAGSGGEGTNATGTLPKAGINPGGGGGGGAVRNNVAYVSGASGGNGKVIILINTTPGIGATGTTLSPFLASTVSASAAQTFSVSGANLTNSLIVSTVSTDFELSTDSAFVSPVGAATITLSGSLVVATPIYIRLKSGLTVGSKTASVSIVSTGANTLTDVSATGDVITAIYYYSGSGLLSSVSNWGTNANGSGTNPTVLTGTLTQFIIRNTTAVSTNAAWVLGANSKLIVGNATVPAVTLTVAGGFPITGTIDIPTASSGSNSVLWKDTSVSPTFGTLHKSSEVHFQPATTASYTMTTPAFGKLFVDGAGAVSFGNSTPLVATLLTVASNSSLSLSYNGTSYLTLGTGAIATINGTLKTTKGSSSGMFSFSGSNTAAVQFADAITTPSIVTLGANSTIEYSNGTNIQIASVLPSGVNYANLTFSGTTGTKSVAGPVSVTGKLTVNITGGGSLAAGGITLKSTATKTAVVAPVTGIISGNVIVERYIPAGSRQYRLLSPATTGGTIHANWQEGQADRVDVNVGFGTHITGAGGAVNGFDATANNTASLFTHNNTGSPAGWVGVANTNINTLSAGSPYLIYLRGSRQLSNINSSTNNATTLRTTGTLVTGTRVVSGLNTTSNGFSLIGNPYQAQVDMQAVLNASTDLVKGFYYVLTPNAAYSTFDLGLNFGTSGNANKYLQPGQACFVKTVAAPTSPALTFTEANKSELVAQTAVFRSKQSANLLRLSLYDVTKPADAVDGLIVAFDAGETNDVNDNDANKLTNFNENMATSNNGILLSIEKRALPTTTDEILLSITKYKGTSYSLKAQGSSLTEIPYLVDAFTGTTTEIPEDGTVDYAYTVDAGNAATTSASRFKLIYAKTLKTINNTVSRFALYPNPSQSNSFNIEVPQSMSKISLRVSNLLGQKLYSQNDLQSGATIRVDVTSIKTAGVYLVSLISDGKITTTKWIVE